MSGILFCQHAILSSRLKTMKRREEHLEDELAETRKQLRQAQRVKEGIEEESPYAHLR